MVFHTKTKSHPAKIVSRRERRETETPRRNLKQEILNSYRSTDENGGFRVERESYANDPVINRLREFI